MTIRRLLLLSLLLAFTAPLLQAQVRVELTLKRRLYMIYEPIVATVSITNLSGRDLTLRDEGAQRWFSFQIHSADKRLIPPRDVNYELSPLTVAAGETLKRSVNLVSLYPVTEFGLFRARASIFSADLGNYFTSSSVSFEVSEGKRIWSQTVGVPEGQPGAGQTRVLSLLSFRQPKDNMLYARVEGESEVFATLPLGRLVSSAEPQILLDQANQLHVLQLVGPKTYSYSQVGVNGEFLTQKTYLAVNSRPVIKQRNSGVVEVVGGQPEVPPDPNAKPGPKLSDRPDGLPVD